MKRYIQIAQHNFLKISVLAMVLILPGCTTGGADALNDHARLIVMLIDSPADYCQVNVEIEEISLKTDGTTENDGWIKLEAFTPGVYNILEFTGGQELPLADMEFPFGTISQIRLKLGKNNSLTIQNHNSTLLLANNTLEGYKFNVNETISKGGTYFYRIDFDAAQSIITVGGTPQMVLKPVLKLLAESTTGTIAGSIQPAITNVLVNVISNNKIIASTYAPENSSRFFIPGIASGTYDLSFESNDGHFQKFIRNISVSVGQVTDIGNNSLEVES